MQSDWQIGDRIRYRWEIHKILGGVGKSGMGIVYVVYDHELHEAFAAKTFQDEAFARSPQVAQRFIQEAHAWINLDIHQNVTQACRVETIAGKPFLFLEYVSGGDLSAWIGTPRLTEDLPQVLRFAIQFCDGMTHALSKGIKAHRDIKPQNCLVTENHDLKVTDFGLATVFDDSSGKVAQESGIGGSLAVHLSQTGTTAGTPSYMAPEQFEDAKHVSVRADVYSFGVMLFQMITGQLPFRGRTGEEFALMHKAAQPPVLEGRLSALNPVLQGCLAKLPEKRFADFPAVRDSLAEIYKKLTGETASQPVTGARLDGTAWTNKGMGLGELGFREEAIACFDRALKLDPSDHRAGLQKAWQEDLRRMDRAAAFERAHKLSEPKPADSPVSRPIGAVESCKESEPQYWLGKAQACLGSRWGQEALACYDRALALEPKDLNIWYAKAVALGLLQRYEEALACYDRILAADPQNERVWFKRGNTLGCLGHIDEAFACYDRAFAHNPKKVAAWFAWGISLEGQERNREALACFERAHRLGHPQAGQAIQKLRQAMAGSGGSKGPAGGT